RTTESVISRVVGLISFLFGSFVLFGGLSWVHSAHLDLFLFRSGHAMGQVVANIPARASRSSSRTSYRALVSFQDDTGRQIRFTEPIGWNPPSAMVGDQVGVFFDPEHSEHAMIDRGARNWLLPVGLALFGGFFMIGGLR